MFCSSFFIDFSVIFCSMPAFVCPWKNVSVRACVLEGQMLIWWHIEILLLESPSLQCSWSSSVFVVLVIVFYAVIFCLMSASFHPWKRLLFLFFVFNEGKHANPVAYINFTLWISKAAIKLMVFCVFVVLVIDFWHKFIVFSHFWEYNSVRQE